MRLFLLLVLFLSLFAANLVFAESPFKALTEIVLDSDSLSQGRVAYLQVSGVEITRVRAAFLDHQYTLLPHDNGSFGGYIAAPLDVPAGPYRLSILVFYADGQQAYFSEEVRTSSGFFGNEEFILPITISELADKEIVLDEYAILDSYIQTLSDGGYWQQTGLLQPFDSIHVSSVFGVNRRFNGGIWQRHTGVDFLVPSETPVTAAAAGRVVLVDSLPIRGNYVLVDHGAGLFTGYAHLSETYVEVGANLAQGDILGAVGSTGRSTGPHLHWEIAIGGAWVEPLEFAAQLE
jgi:murein DD-endopeptidase MepM/ murein hydrolase activator NlpD